MKSMILCLVIITLVSGILHAQQGTTAGPTAGMNSGASLGLPATIFLSDIQGIRQGAEFNFREVKGTPFFKSGWSACTIQLTDNRVFEKVTGRMNLYNNGFHYLNANQEELLAPASRLRLIEFADTTEAGINRHVFANGYPAIDNNSTETYYEVLQNGKVQLLMLTRKKLIELKGGIGMPGAEKEFMKVDLYYVVKDGVISAVKKDKNFLPEYLSDKKQELTDFIQRNSLRCKSIAEIRQVVSYYNTL